MFFFISLLVGCTSGYIPQEIEPNPSFTSSKITYEANIKTLISNNCISCHSGINPQGNLLLENYNQVRISAESGALIQRINDVSNPMPTTGLMPLSDRLLFDSWAQNGYFED